MLALWHAGSATLFVALALTAFGGESQAATFKCQVNGRTVYQDAPCPGVPDSKPYTPRNPINTISSEAMTGKAKEPVDKRPDWVKNAVPNPVEECKAKGGKIDRELRACMLP